MSAAFWVELGLALLGFVVFIWLVSNFKTKLVQRAEARQLRKLLVPEFQALLPALAAQLYADELGTESYAHNNVAITRFQQSLDQVLKSTASFYSDERAVLSEFSVALESLLPDFQSQILTRVMLEELILLGQRAVHEMTENGY